jgi:hypothetical protein
MRALPRQFEALADLIWALVNERLDAAGAAQLRQLLEADAANRRVYVELMDQFASLEWERAEGKRSQSPEESPQKDHQRAPEKTPGPGAHPQTSGQGPAEPIEGWAMKSSVQCPIGLCWGRSSSVHP